MKGMTIDEPLHRNAQRVTAAAAERGVEVVARRFPAGTRTAVDAAAAIGCPLDAIVKSIVLATDGGPALVLTSGGNRVDYAKVGAALAVEGVRRADADEARRATGYPIGGTAPFGHPEPVRMLFDSDLLAFDRVWAAAGTPDTVFPVVPQDLLRATGAVLADVAER